MGINYEEDYAYFRVGITFETSVPLIIGTFDYNGFSDLVNLFLEEIGFKSIYSLLSLYENVTDPLCFCVNPHFRAERFKLPAVHPDVVRDYINMFLVGPVPQQEANEATKSAKNATGKRKLIHDDPTDTNQQRTGGPKAKKQRE